VTFGERRMYGGNSAEVNRCPHGGRAPAGSSGPTTDLRVAAHLPECGPTASIRTRSPPPPVTVGDYGRVGDAAGSALQRSQIPGYRHAQTVSSFGSVHGLNLESSALTDELR
jgi:hypothetical protein